MNRFILAVAGVALAVSPAFAADLPMKAPVKALPPPATWTGCYFGVSVGGDWSHSNDGWSGITEGAGGFAVGGATLLPAAANGSMRSSSAIGGAGVGCNYQTGMFVFGAEGDINATGLSGSRSAVSLASPSIVPGIINESYSSNWLSTIRGRAGIANGDWLFYGTGGAAIAHLSVADSVCFPTAAIPSCSPGSAGSTRTGWVAGGGVEYRIGGGWSAKLEYLHADLGNFSYLIPAAAGFPNSSVTVNRSLTEDIVRLGFNLQFTSGLLMAKY